MDNSRKFTRPSVQTGCSPGLSGEEAEKSRLSHGSNELTRKKRKSFPAQFLANLGDPILRILIGALVVNVIFMIGDINWFETGGIAAAILLAALVSTISEYGSGLAFERLCRDSENSVSRVLRDGQVIELSPSEIVVGDIVFLQPGDVIPADGRICRGMLSVNQAALSGESAEASKRPDSGIDNGQLVWELERSGLLFRGSAVCAGEGEMQVLRVGDETFYGNVAARLQDQTRPSPLKHRLSVLASGISFLGYVAAGMIAFAYLFNVFAIDSGMDWDIMLARISDWRYVFSELLHALTLAVSVIVVAVPEGLPMMITVVLSSNMKRMLRDNVLVRKLVGIETAGSLSILFTDKTGTLTTGELRVGVIMRGDGVEYASAAKLKRDGALCDLLSLNARYNSASMISEEGENHAHAVGGNATDRALLDYFLSDSETAAAPAVSYSVIEKIPFDSAVKFSAVRIKPESGERTPLTFIKGAPELLLPTTKQYIGADGVSRRLDTAALLALRQRWNELASQAYRVIAIVMDMSSTPIATLKGNAAALRQRELTLVALIGIRDEIRREAKAAVTQVREAGIRVVMITGDNEMTAAAVAQECGILPAVRSQPEEKRRPFRRRSNEAEQVRQDLIVTGTELTKLDDVELAAIMPRLAVVARALPSDKSRLVRVAQDAGLVVGMTGDGINDAPALTAADVGFAMGSGTDVAKEAGDIVIVDNNFSSIAKAVLYGRTIFESIRKFIMFQLTMNFSALGVSLICPFVGIETPVTVAQMLWVNIIMDTLGGLAFAGEPPLPEYMKQPPKPRDEKILTGSMICGILLTGAYTVALGISFLKLDCVQDFLLYGYDDIYLLTAFFGLFIFCGIFNCFNARTTRIRLTAHLAHNKPFIFIMVLISAVQIFLIYYGGTFFRTVPLDSYDMIFTILLAATVIPFDMTRKMISGIRRRRKNRRRA